MIRSMGKLTAIICVAIFFSACASYAQSEYQDPGYWGIIPYSNENVWQTSELTGRGGYDSWGSPTHAEIPEPSEGAYFPSSVSESLSTLVDETTSYQYGRTNAATNGSAIIYPLVGGTGTSKNIFWIVSKDGTKHWRSINIPCHRYARLLIIPSSSGQLITEERYPDGQVRSHNFGNVRAYNQYRTWFFADTSGTHLLRYRIDNDPYSDILTFHVGSCGTPEICPCCGQLINR
jgi:hypothetical protein